MKDFEKARKLFDAYQKSGKLNELGDSLDILDEIIESQGTDSQRAINFKQIIMRHIDAQLNGILAKGNITEFEKHLKDDGDVYREWVVLLSGALGEDDLGRLFRLFRVRQDYFK